MRVVISCFLLAVLAGCQPKGSSIADHLRANGVPREALTKIVLSACDSSYGDFTVTVADKAELDSLWDALEKSYRSEPWCACMLGDAQFYTAGSDEPIATLSVHGSEGSILECGGKFVRFECERFRILMDQYLEAAYNAR